MTSKCPYNFQLLKMSLGLESQFMNSLSSPESIHILHSVRLIIKSFVGTRLTRCIARSLTNVRANRNHKHTNSQFNLHSKRLCTKIQISNSLIPTSPSYDLLPLEQNSLSRALILDGMIFIPQIFFLRFQKVFDYISVSVTVFLVLKMYMACVHSQNRIYLHEFISTVQVR